MRPHRITTIGVRSVVAAPGAGGAIVSHGHGVGGGGGGGTMPTARTFVTVTSTTPPPGITVVKLVPPGSDGLYVTAPVQEAVHVNPAVTSPTCGARPTIRTPHFAHAHTKG